MYTYNVPELEMTPALSDMPGHLIRRLNQQSTAVFQQRLKAGGHDITPVQFSALAKLAENPGLDQATLAGLIEYDRATIGGVVKRLVQKGLIARHPSETDRRAFRLTLTPSAHQLLAAIWPVVIDLQRGILTPLSNSEQLELVKLMQKALGLESAG